MDSAAISKIPSDRLANFCAIFLLLGNASAAPEVQYTHVVRQLPSNPAATSVLGVKNFFFLQLCGILDRKRHFYFI